MAIKLIAISKGNNHKTRIPPDFRHVQNSDSTRFEGGTALELNLQPFELHVVVLVVNITVYSYMQMTLGLPSTHYVLMSISITCTRLKKRTFQLIQL